MPYRSPLCRKYIEKSWWRRIGWTTSRVSPASSSSGVVHAYWCCIGTSGTFMPTIRPILGPHTAPLRLHGSNPTILDLDAGDLGLAVELHAALPGQPGHRLTRPDGLGDAVRGN